jgi:hypothetical protein
VSFATLAHWWPVTIAVFFVALGLGCGWLLGRRGRDKRSYWDGWNAGNKARSQQYADDARRPAVRPQRAHTTAIQPRVVDRPGTNDRTQIHPVQADRTTTIPKLSDKTETYVFPWRKP